MSAHMGLTCCICRQRGLPGTRILSLFLCAACEAGIVHTRVGEPEYDHYVQQLRVMWRVLGEAAPCSEQ